MAAASALGCSCNRGLNKQIWPVLTYLSPRHSTSHNPFMLLFSLPQELLRLLLLSTSFDAWRIAASPSVNVALQASFDAPPYILELL